MEIIFYYFRQSFKFATPFTGGGTRHIKVRLLAMCFCCASPCYKFCPQNPCPGVFASHCHLVSRHRAVSPVAYGATLPLHMYTGASTNTLWMSDWWIFSYGTGSCRGYLARQVESHACSKFARGDTICISLIVVSDTRNTLCRRFVHDEWEHVFSEARRKQGSVAKKNPNMFRSLCHQEYT